jgi:hypothetical protein
MLSALICLALITKGRYPFEKYLDMKYQECDDWEIYDMSEEEEKVRSIQAIPDLFGYKDSMTVELISFIENWDSSYIYIYRNSKQIQRFFEPMGFSSLNVNEPIRVADINGDDLCDIKLVILYNGTGLASMNVRVIYLFQKPDGSFTKISFDDKMDDNRPERDFDKDGNYEIITMNLFGHEDHSYWVFNLFEYKDNELVNANSKDNYPIMIQFLHRENFEITNKISRKKMKDFELNLPDEFDKK